MPWLTGNGTTPLTGRRFVIPDDDYFIAAVMGALVDLTYASNWDAFGSVTPDEAAAAALQMLMSVSMFDVEDGEMKIGAVVIGLFDVPPLGWLPLDGGDYLMSEYPELMENYPAVLKNVPSAGRFVVPNIIGRVPVGQGGAYAFNATGGATTHTLTVNEMPSHRHEIKYRNSTQGSANNPALISGTTGDTQSPYGFSDYVGGGQAHNNMQPYIVLPFFLVAK